MSTASGEIVEAGASARGRRPLQVVWLWVEMLGLFFGLPGLIAVVFDPAERFRPLAYKVGLGDLAIWDRGFGGLMFPLLFMTTAVILLWLLFARSFDNRQLWAWDRARLELRRVLVQFAVCAVLLVGAAWVLSQYTDVIEPDGFFGLPRRNLGLMLVIATFYPVVSAYPQEITHRAFFFWRYRAILPGRWAMIGVNAVAFMWLHVFFWNWIALGVTLAGGLLFAWTYDRSRSTLAAGIEHGLYGVWLFATGLGWFVYTGSIGAG